MSRIILFAVLFACLVYLLQAGPVPDDAPSLSPSTSPSTLDMDDIANKAQKLINDAKEAIQNGDLLDKTKTFLENAGENIKKEVEKIVDKLRD